jgi:uncharacterized protein DUF5518
LIQPALLGGVFIGVLSALPIINLANCCCLWIMAGGALAAYLDQAADRPNNLARGALDGLLAGIIGTFVWLFASLAVDVVMAPLQERMLTMILEGPADLPPGTREWLEDMRTEGPFRYILGFMFQLGAGMIFGTLGGLLGALFFWRDGVPPALGGTPPPPPLP